MSRQRRSFGPSLKLEVVRMIKEQGLNISHVSQTMDIGVTAIRRTTDSRHGLPVAPNVLAR
jgi:transposase